MRLWSIHPSYLDRQGLLAVWREALLAKSVLTKIILGEAYGYKNHPQLHRFKIPLSILYIDLYLVYLCIEAEQRRYNFDKTKIGIFAWYIAKTNAIKSLPFQMTVSDAQLEYEFNHLQNKLWNRDKNTYYKNLSGINDTRLIDIKPHPIFEVVHGKIESWEKVK